MDPTPPPPPTPEPPRGPHAKARPLKASLGLLTPLWWVLGVALASVVVLVLAARWVLLTEAGTAWVLARLPMVTEARGVRGALLGPEWQAERLRVQWAGGQEWLLLEGLRSEGMRWRWLPDDARGPLWLALDVQSLLVRRAELDTGPRGPRPIPLPVGLSPPLRLQVASARVGELRIDGGQPLTEVAVDGLQFDGSPGARHRVARIAGRGYGLQLLGDAEIGNARPFDLRANATLAPALVAEADAPPWAAAVTAKGPLAEFNLRAAWRGRPVAMPAKVNVGSAGSSAGSSAVSTAGSAPASSAARMGPALDADAVVRPLEAWPVSELNLSTEALDLSALHAGAPQTRLFGEAQLQAASAVAPVALRAALDNRLPGRWNEGRIPATRLALEARGELARPERLELSRFVVELAEARGVESGPAGQIEGRALWRAHQLELDARLAEVRPQRLDSRAPGMVLSGPVRLTIQGLPLPPGAQSSAPARPEAAAAGLPVGASAAESASAASAVRPAPAASATASPAKARSPAAASTNAAPAGRSPLPPWSVAGTVELEGRIDGAPKPVLVRAEGHASATGAEFKHLQVRSGDAQAVLSARIARNSAREWALASQGSLAEFDPLPWWPGEAGSPWRRGPHRLNAGWQFELRAPADAAVLSPVALLPRLAGNGRLRLHDSVLAGVPLSGEATLGYAAVGSGGTAAAGSGSGSGPGTGSASSLNSGSLRADLQVGGNRLLLEGSGDPAGGGERDRWKAELRATQLGTLVPLARLHAGLAEWLPTQGQIEAEVAATGRWPRLATQGQARAQGVQGGALSLARAQARWRLDLAEPGVADAPLTFDAEATGLRVGKQAIDAVRAELRGTRAQHRVELTASLPAAPGAEAARVLKLGGRGGTQVALRATGQWQSTQAGSPGSAGAGGGRWFAQVDEISLGPTEPQPNAAPKWAEARNLRAQLQFDAQGQLQALSAEPGRVVLADSFALRWEAVTLDWQRERADFAFRADIDPFLLAPLLQRWRPTFGWQGDLRLAAHVQVRAAERFEASLAFARIDGDLHVETQGDLQLLGLTDFRLLLRVRDGLWDFEPVFRGRGLGEIRGRLRATTGAERRWPHGDAPLEGQVQLRVPDIGVWGHWVPPGWRLTGELATVAQVGGRFAEPTYTGELTGKGLAVRNLLQGVNMNEGQLRVRLAGSSAQIETFSLRGGEGRINVSGQAELGAQPSARLKLTAERFRVLGRVDRMLTASGEAELALTAEASQLEGRFKVDEGLFDFTRADAPSLDDDVSVRGAAEPGATASGGVAPAPRRNHRFNLGVDVELGQNLRAKGRGVDTGLSGALRLTNPGGRLAVRGAIESVEGTYAAYGQKLSLEKSSLTFSGQPDNPWLDIVAVRPNLDQRVGLQVTGPLQGLRVRLFSDPEMSETDKLSWLVLGRASDGLGRNDTALLQRAAIALLAGEGEAPTDAFMRRLGIDELSLKQSEGDVRETVVSLGKQLSRRWYLGYERSVNATTGTWQLIYRAAQRFTLRAQSGLENSLDLIWTWRLQTPPEEGGVRKSLPAARP